MEEDGVWRTVGGRRIFIKDGQSLSGAMKESGKFGDKEEQNTETMGKSDLSEPLTDEDKEVLDYYVQEAGGMGVNFALRNNENLFDDEKKLMTDLDKVLDKSTVNQDTTVYRYMSERGQEEFKNLKVGETYTDKGYMSTTLSQETDRESDYMSYSAKMIINAPKGSKGLDVSSIYDKKAFEGSQESEIVFARNQTLKLISKERDKYDERDLLTFELII